MDDDAEAAAYAAFEDACAEAGYGEPPRTPEHDAVVNEMVRRIQAQHEALMQVFPPRDDR